MDEKPPRFTLLNFFTRWPGSEQQLQLILTLVIGAVVGLVVVAFIVLTENLGAKLYPAGGAAWRRVLIPLAGAPDYRTAAVQLFPECPRQRHPANQVRDLHQQRLHFA